MNLEELVASLMETLHQSVNIVMLAIHQVQFSGAKNIDYLVFIGNLRAAILCHDITQHNTTYHSSQHDM